MRSKRFWLPVLASVVVVGVTSLATAAIYPAVTQAADSAASEVRLGRGTWDGDRDQSEALAEALGISEEELEAAIESAQQAAIDQAVAEGRLTEEQAEVLAERDFGRFAWRGLGSNDTLLAEALGITVDELTAAREQVVADQLAQAVEDGDMTQAQVDRMLAQRAFEAYQQDEARAEMEAAVQAALEADAITQEQADLLLEDLAQGFWHRGLFGHERMERGFGGDSLFERRGFPGGGRGEHGGWGFPGQMPDDLDDSDESEQSDPEESGQESQSSYTLPDVSF